MQEKLCGRIDPRKSFKTSQVAAVNICVFSSKNSAKGLFNC
jgi:hypothetical protein